MAISTDNTFTAGTTITSADVNTNFSTHLVGINENFEIYHTILEGGVLIQDTTALTYYLTTSSSLTQTATAASSPACSIYFDDADYSATGETQRLRLRAQFYTNATAPAITYTVGLYPISSVAGGSDQLAFTLGTVESGSTVAFATQSASTLGQNLSGDFSIPDDGHYALGVVSSGTQADDSEAHLVVQLQRRNT